jgi:hypothetical protein
MKVDSLRNGKERDANAMMGEFNRRNHFRTKKSISPEVINRDHNLSNKSVVDRHRSQNNFSGPSNNLVSLSADKISSNDPESIERQNN